MTLSVLGDNLKLGLKPPQSTASWVHFGRQQTAQYPLFMPPVNRQAVAASLNAQLLQVSSSPAFFGQVQRLVLTKLPVATIRDILKSHFTLLIKHHITDKTGDPNASTDTDFDLTGGLQEIMRNKPSQQALAFIHFLFRRKPTIPDETTGRWRQRISIAEFVRLANNNQWVENGFWQNGTIHEMMHGLSFVLGRQDSRYITQKNMGNNDPEYEKLTIAQRMQLYGVSESPAFRTAWKKDYAAMPSELKYPRVKGKKNWFYYYIRPDKAKNKDGSNCFINARKETVAEAGDIILRGKASRINYDNFHQYFPNTLQVTQTILENHYGNLHLDPETGYTELHPLTAADGLHILELPHQLAVQPSVISHPGKRQTNGDIQDLPMAAFA